MLVNKVSPATLCPQEELPTSYDCFSQRPLEIVSDCSQHTQLSQYSQTSLDLFSQPLPSSQSSQSRLAESMSTGEDGSRQRCITSASYSLENTAPRPAAPHCSTRSQPQRQSSKYYMKYMSLSSVAASLGKSLPEKEQIHCPAAHTAVSKASYEQWLSKRSTQTTETVISTTKNCAKEIRSVMEDLKTQVHEQFNQWSQEEDHRRKEHGEQQRAIFTQLVQGQQRIQQELACIKQSNAEVCTKIELLERDIKELAQSHSTDYSSLCEMVHKVAQQAPHTHSPSVCCHKQVPKKECSGLQETSLTPREILADITPPFLQQELDQQVPGEGSISSDPVSWLTDTLFQTHTAPATNKSEQWSIQHKTVHYVNKGSCSGSQRSAEISLKTVDHTQQYAHTQTNQLNVLTDSPLSMEEGRHLNTRPSCSAVPMAGCRLVASPCTQKPARKQKVRHINQQQKRKSLGRSQPRTPVLTRARSKRPQQHEDSSSEDEEPSRRGLLPANKRPDLGTSKSPVIIDDCVFLTSQNLNSNAPLPKPLLSSFQRRTEEERRRALIQQSMMPGSQELIREIASSVKAQLQRKT